MLLCIIRTADNIHIDLLLCINARIYDDFIYVIVCNEHNVNVVEFHIFVPVIDCFGICKRQIKAHSVSSHGSRASELIVRLVNGSVLYAFNNALISGKFSVLTYDHSIVGNAVFQQNLNSSARKSVVGCEYPVYAFAGTDGFFGQFFPALFVGKVYFSPLNCPDSLVKIN